MHLYLGALIVISLALDWTQQGVARAGTVMQTAQFNHETPERLYNIYLDPAQHAAACSTEAGSVAVETKIGGEVTAFNGKLKARILHLVPGRVIVLAWRTFKFDEVGADTLDSTVTLTFRANDSGAEVELVQVNVPDQLLREVNTHWNTLYWDKWKTYLANTRGSSSR